MANSVITSVITKDTMRKLLDTLSQEYTLVGPVDNGKVVEFKEAAAADILMDDRISYKSLKEYYFPRVEKMISFTDGQAVDNTENIKGVVIFGAKPCDTEALRVMREVFLTGRYTDPFFQKHFDANVLIGVGCLEEKPGCFCAGLGLDKGFSDFCDIMLTDTQDGYIVEHLSEKGKAVLAKIPETQDITCENTRTAQPNGDTVLGISAEADDASLFSCIDWKKATEICQGCGMCTYICPTCHCFDFKDVAEDGSVSRYKCWDSCMYPKFTLHASGHNPREQRFERYRQRVLHKYVYVKKNFGYTACTGCGRCIRSCPVGMNIKDVVQEIMEVQP